MMKKHHKLPKIFRFITDFSAISFSKSRKHRLIRIVKILSLALVGIAMFFLLGISGHDLYINYQNKQKIDLERQEIISKIEKWQGIVNKYKDYRDGYFQLAILEYRLRDFVKSKFYLDRALTLDPNFEKGREFEKVLSIAR